MKHSSRLPSSSIAREELEAARLVVWAGGLANAEVPAEFPVPSRLDSE